MKTLLRSWRYGMRKARIGGLGLLGAVAWLAYSAVPSLRPEQTALPAPWIAAAPSLPSGEAGSRAEVRGGAGQLPGGGVANTGPGLTPVSPEHPRRWTNSLGMVFVQLPEATVAFSLWETRRRDFEAFARDHNHNGGYDYRHGRSPYVLKTGEWKARGWEFGWHSPGFEQSENDPITCVSWLDAQAFCRWLTAVERQAGRIGTNQNYRLPSDAEWSLAVGLPEARDGAPQAKDGKILGTYPWGTQWPPPPGFGNYAGGEVRDADWPRDYDGSIHYCQDAHARTAVVGSYPANRLGLYDLSGNVWEWCEDAYRSQIPGAVPRGVLSASALAGDEGEPRVLRGGSWFSHEREDLLSSKRILDSPSLRSADYGFRCVFQERNAP